MGHPEQFHFMAQKKNPHHKCNMRSTITGLLAITLYLLLIYEVKSGDHTTNIVQAWVTSLQDDKLCFALILDAAEHDEGIVQVFKVLTYYLCT